MVGKALNLLGVLGEHPEGIAMAPLAREVGYPLSHGPPPAGEPRPRRVRRGRRAHQALVARPARLPARPARLTRARLQRGRPADPAARHRHHPGGDADGRPGRRPPALRALRRGPAAALSVIGEPGKLGPLHCTGQGKALVAFAAPPSASAWSTSSRSTPRTDHTITDREAFRAEIERVRTQGWAMADEEHEAGIRAIGVPVLGLDGIAIAAISTAAPAFRIPAEEHGGALRPAAPRRRPRARRPPPRPNLKGLTPSAWVDGVWPLYPRGWSLPLRGSAGRRRRSPAGVRSRISCAASPPRRGAAAASSWTPSILPPRKRAAGVDLRGQQRADAAEARGGEVLVAREVAERVGDQPPAVELEPAQDVRAAAQHEVRARVDRHPREVPRVAAELAERDSGPCGTRVWSAPSAPAWKNATTTSACRRRAAHQRLHRRVVGHRRAPRVGREARRRRPARPRGAR